jgi:stearoyl-CoA desaturase (delta-9 desaturase)
MSSLSPAMRAPAPIALGNAPSAAFERYPNVLDYVFYAGFHLICFAAFWTGVTWRDIALCAVCYVTRMFGLMAGYHRYFAHRSYKTSRAFQFLLAMLGTLGVQKGVLWWASTHRHHHRYSDTELDLHSPIHRSFLYAHSGWFLDQANRSTDLSRVPDLCRYSELVWLNRWDLLPITLFAFLIWLGFGWSGLIWGFFISTILIWHAIHAIGSFGHRFGGYRRFATADNSRNKWFLAVVLLGEGWHNNHHFYPGSARHGFVWWEYDIVYRILKGLERLGLVWDLRVPPDHVRHTTDPDAHVRVFEGWLMQLRLALTKRLEEAGTSEPRERLRLLQQSIEMRLDAFGLEAVDQILRNPEQLRATVATLRNDIASDARRLCDGSPRLVESLDAELLACLDTWSFAHLVTGTERVAPARHAHAV